MKNTHAVITARNQGANLCLAHIFSIALGIFRTLQVVLKRSRLLLNFTLLNCLGVGMVTSCLLVPELASNHLTAVIALTTTFDIRWVWSGNPVENNSYTSHSNIVFSLLGYHNVCARQWQRYSPWVIKMFLQVRYPEASSNSST